MRQHFEEERTRPLLLVRRYSQVYLENIPVGRFQRTSGLLHFNNNPDSPDYMMI